MSFTFMNLINQINQLFHDIQIYWDAPLILRGHADKVSRNWNLKPKQG